jgi:hypothetical protein
MTTRAMAWSWIACGLAAATVLCGCVKPVRPDPQMAAIQRRFGMLKLSWLTRRVVAGEAIACGYAGPPRRAQVFIARGPKVFVPSDLPPEQFDHWEDQLCGPDWIKPVSF